MEAPPWIGDEWTDGQAKRWLMKVLIRAAVLILATGSHAMAQGSQANLPISVIGSSYNPAQESVEFTLLNGGNRVVTAWHVVARAKGSDGSILKSTGFGTDSYLSAAGVLPKGSHINPGETLTMRMRFPAILDATVTVEPAMAVLSDGTAFGDLREIEYVFKLRDRDYDTWTEVLGVLQDARRGDVGLMALRTSEDRLRSPLKSDNENPVRENALRNVRIAIADAEQGKANPVTRMQILIDEAERRLSAATASRRASAR